jgi:iron complex transport system ATP-binding protein
MKRYADARNHAIVAILHDINQAMHHFDRLILVKDGNLVGDHPSGIGAISDLADLYQIQLDVIERDELASIGFSEGKSRAKYPIKYR